MTMLAALIAQAEGQGADLVTLRAMIEEATEAGPRPLTRARLRFDARRAGLPFLELDSEDELAAALQRLEPLPALREPLALRNDPAAAIAFCALIAAEALLRRRRRRGPGSAR